MATGKFTVTLKKLAKGMKATRAKMAKAGDAPPSNFVFEFDQDVVGCTVYGVAADGSQVDISGVATLAVVSSDETVVTIKDISGMTFTMSGVKSGNAVVTATATWTDGSATYGFDLPVTVTGGGVTGIVVVPGTPTPRP